MAMHATLAAALTPVPESSMLLSLAVAASALFLSATELGEDQAVIDMDKVTCGEWLNSSGNDALAGWLYGYVSAKKGDLTVTRSELNGMINTDFVKACTGHEDMKMIDALTAPGAVDDN